MPPSGRKPLLAVVSPFIDKRHGTERCVAEQIERLAAHFEIHLYSSRVEDISVESIKWHSVYIPRGPELLRLPVWLLANALVRWKDRLRGIRPHATYSPGPNCFDADVISVHAIFARVRRASIAKVGVGDPRDVAWPRRLHRGMYYLLAEGVERAVYGRGGVTLVAVSKRTATDVARFFRRNREVGVLYNAVDQVQFSPERRRELRPVARQALNLSDGTIAILLIGNDFRNKGLAFLVEAINRLGDLNLCLLVAGSDSPDVYETSIRQRATGERLKFLPIRRDVEFYFAAADIYASPSLEDAFPLPPLEAMACGLPVITSRFAGTCEIMRDGEDGLILEDPFNVSVLTGWIRNLAVDSGWRDRLGQAAARTAANYTWDRNAEQLRALIEQVLSQR
jgi:UDP-glucose:(heptosyl)LPS alpha-1,3-glucosyltransferase